MKSNKPKEFLEYLFSIGYETYERCWDKKSSWKKIGKFMPDNWSNVYMGVTQRYLVKDENFDYEKVIQWGLCDGLIVNRTVTLRWPLPNDLWEENLEVEMPKIFELFSPEEILKSMFDKNHKLEY